MIATLTAEHLVMLNATEETRNNLAKLRENQDVASVQAGLLDFSHLIEHTVHQHFPQEEEKLFPKLQEKDKSLMEQEHREVGQAHQDLKAELQQDIPDPKAIIFAVEALVDKLEGHLRRENDILANL